MQSYFNNNKKLFLLLLPLTFNLIFVLSLSHFLGNSFLQPIDSDYYTSAVDAETQMLNIWNEDNFGNRSLAKVVWLLPNYFSKVLHSIGISTKVNILAAYFTMLSLMSYSSIFAIHKILKLFSLKNKPYSALIGSIFYTYGLQSSLLLSGGIALSLVVLLSTLPVIAYLFILAFTKNLSRIQTIFLGIILGLNYNNIHFTLPVIICFTFPYFIFGSGPILKRVITVFSIITVSILVGFGFLLTYFLFMYFPDPYRTINPYNNYIFSSQGISGFFSFFYNWTIGKVWDGVSVFANSSYYHSFPGILSIFTLWIIPVLILVKVKTSDLKKVVMYLLISSVLSIFLAKGGTAPFSGVNMLLYENIPFWGIFRTPNTKFGLVPTISMSILTAISFSFFSSRNLIKVLVIVSVVLHTFVFFNPYVYISQPPRSKKVSVPSEYMKVAEILNSAEGNILFYPGYNSEYFTHTEGLDYLGKDILGTLISKPILYAESDTTFIKSSEVIQDYLNNPLGVNIGNFNTSHILVRNDLENHSSQKFYETIDNDKRLSLEYKSKSFAIYSVKKQFFEEKFTALVASDKVDINVTKHNNTEYTLEVPSSATKLIMRTSYYPLWKLVKMPENLTVSGPVIYEDYANSWNLDKFQNSDDSFIEYRLVLMLQKEFYLGLLFSFFWFLLFTFYLVYLKVVKKENLFL